MSRIKWIANSALTVCALAAATGTPAAEAADQYRVSATIAQHGSHVADPILVAKAGTPAQMAVSGEDGYRFMVTIDPAEGEHVEVSTQVVTSEGNVQSVVVTTLGSPIAVSTVDIALELTVEREDG